MLVPALVWLGLLIGVTHCFILDGACTVPSRCRCHSWTVSCGNTGLTTFPTFNFTLTAQRSSLTIYLQGNALTSVPGHAFRNVYLAGTQTVNLKLSDNHIHVIDTNAFAELTNITLYLDISNNKITALPGALLQLHNLEKLHMLGNRIIFLNNTIMTAMQKSLQDLQLDMSVFAIWPLELSHLSELSDMTLDQIPFRDIPIYSFNGLLKLRYLTITNSSLTKIPEALCKLQTLVKFEFSNHNSIPNSIPHLFPSCQHSLPGSTVNLDNNHLYTFPGLVFAVFNNMRTLSVNHNNLDTINPSSVPSRATLYSLNLSNNRFTTIPGAVSKMTNLRTLIMSDNYITHVDQYVLSSLAHISQVTLNNNPIIEVDPHAFGLSFSLTRLDLQHTNLTAIPAAILHSDEYFSLYMYYSPVECTCDRMAFLKAIPRHDIESHKKRFYGNCVNTNVGISSFISNTLPDCP